METTRISATCVILKNFSYIQDPNTAAKSQEFGYGKEITLHNWPISILASNGKRVEKAGLDTIRPIREHSHGNPCSLKENQWKEQEKQIESNEWIYEGKIKNTALSIGDEKVRLTLGVPRSQSRIWSQAALAADNALDSFLTLRMTSPRCWTVVINSFCNLSNIED